MHSNVCCGIYSQELWYKSNPMNELINQWISINGQMNIEVMTNTHANTNWNIFSDIKRMKSCHFQTTWMDAEGFMLSEMSQRRTYGMIFLNMESKTKQKQVYLYREQIGGFCWKQRVGEMDGGYQMVERTAITRARGGQLVWKHACIYLDKKQYNSGKKSF